MRRAFTRLTLFFVLATSNANASFQFVNDCPTIGDYEYCEIKVDSYPEPIALISAIDAKVTSFRVHWHGYVLDPNSPYDKSLKSYVESLSLLPTHAGEMVVIPKSVGKCDTYFKNVSSLPKFLTVLNDFAPEKVPVDISVHSGAGTFMANLLSRNEEISNLAGIHFVDAVYSDASAELIKNWKRSHPDIDFSVSYVSGTATQKYSEKLISGLKGVTRVRNYKFNPLEPTIKPWPHYLVLKEVWGFL